MPVNDFTLIASDGTKVKVNKDLLCAFSAFFKEKLSSDCALSKYQTDVEREHLENMVWVFEGTTDPARLDWEMMEALVDVALKFKVWAIQTSIRAELPRCIQTDCINVYQFAAKLNDKDLALLAIHEIVRQGHKIDELNCSKDYKARALNYVLQWKTAMFNCIAKQVCLKVATHTHLNLEAFYITAIRKLQTSPTSTVDDIYSYALTNHPAKPQCLECNAVLHSVLKTWKTRWSDSQEKIERSF